MPTNKALNGSHASETPFHTESSASFIDAAVSNWFSAAVLTTNFQEVQDETTSESTLRNTPGVSGTILSDGLGTPNSPASGQRTSKHQTPAKNTRKGHTKSRLGCYNCKRRRIKCQENYPSCHNCTRGKLQCEYPPDQLIRFVQSSQSSALRDSVQLQSTPTLFTPSDMKLFHHFIMNAYPHLPLGNDKVWVHEIASFSHSYDFLLHSMLGMAASHLTLTSDLDLAAEALSHRVLAMRGLNDALSKPPKTSADADALLAACYALAFQSSYMGESISEFLTMLRGCALIIAQNWTKKLGSVFKDVGIEGQTRIILSRLDNLPAIDSKLVSVAKASLEQLRPLCQNTAEEVALQSLLNAVYSLGMSSRDAYFKFTELYHSLALMSHNDFQLLSDPGNSFAQILLAHFVAVQILMLPIKSREWMGREMGKPNRRTVFRMDRLYHNVPAEMRKYLDWPISICESTYQDSG